MELITAEENFVFGVLYGTDKQPTRNLGFLRDTNDVAEMKGYVKHQTSQAAVTAATNRAHNRCGLGAHPGHGGAELQRATSRELPKHRLLQRIHQLRLRSDYILRLRIPTLFVGLC